jgi:hypothetical protein
LQGIWVTLISQYRLNDPEKAKAKVALSVERAPASR